MYMVVSGTIFDWNLELFRTSLLFLQFLRLEFGTVPYLCSVSMIFRIEFGTVPYLCPVSTIFAIGIWNCSVPLSRFYDFSIGILELFRTSVLFLRFFYWNLELFRQCGIFWFFILLHIDEGYSIHATWALNVISTFLFQHTCMHEVIILNKLVKKRRYI